MSEHIEVSSVIEWMNEFLITYYKPGRPISQNVGS